MTSTLLRVTCALAMALGLSACGGKAEFKVAGTVNGLVYPGLVLTSNGQELAVAPTATGNNTEFSFPNTISYGDEYAVAIKTDPAHQECALYEPIHNAKGTAGQLATINVLITCVIKQQAVGGKVTGLTSTGLVVINGSTGGGAAIDPSKTLETFDYTVPKVPYNVAYSLSILTQPLFDNCAFTGKSYGIIADAAVTGVDISCTRVELGGSVTGLTVAGLVLKNEKSGLSTTVLKDATSFTFGRASSLVDYDIKVATQPAGLTCTVTNGLKVTAGPAMPISVACVAG